MKTARGQQQSAAGSVLVTSVVVITIIGIVLGSYLLLIRTQNLSVARSQAWNAAIAVAEAGVEEALAHLNPGVTRTLPARDAHGWTLGADKMYHLPNAPHHLANGHYDVTISADLFPVIYATGYVQVPISSAYVSRTLEVRTGAGYLFPAGVVAEKGIDLKGNNINIDSYDSADTNAFPNGRYNAANARDHGDVATNDTMTNSFNVGNANIKGKIRVGPSGVPRIGANGSVGDNAWVNGGNKGLKPGWLTDDMNMEFPEVLPPFSTASPPASGTVDGTNYTYVLGSGNYMLSTLNLKTGDTLFVAPGANAVLYVTDNVLMQGSSKIDVATNANLQLYVGGASATFTTINTASTATATAFQYYGLPSNKDLSWSGNAEFVGTVYAPSATFTLGGGGSTAMDYQGACVVNSVKMNGHFNFHYDENLRRPALMGGLVATSWREL